MTSWPQFQSHKVVQATPIVRIEQVTAGFGASTPPILFVDPSAGREAFERFLPTEPAMARHCRIGDYALIYRDGYRSLCPKKEFEDGYTRKMDT